MRHAISCAVWMLSCVVLPGQGEAVPAPADARLARIYDMGRVLAAVGAATRDPQAQGGERDRAPLDGASPAASAVSDPAAAARAVARAGLEGLANAVRGFVRPELRADEEVQVLGERWLVLLGRPEQHAWLERFIVEGAAESVPLGRLIVDVVALPTATFGMVVLPALQQDGAKPGDATLLEPGEATDAFVKALLEHPDGTRFETPPSDLLPLRPTTISKLQQTAYVRDFDVEIAQGTVVADPLVGVIEDGLSVLAVGKALGDSIGLSIQAQVAELQRPIPTFTTTLGVGQPVTIQLPQVISSKIDAAVELKEGQVLALTLPPLAGKRCLALVRIDARQPRRVQDR